jgi:hypothetical protein
MLTSGPVVIMQMPEQLNLDGVRTFLQEVEPLLECPESEVILELMRVARVFEAFTTSDEAVRSFNGIPAEAVPQDVPWCASVFGEMGTLKQAS